MRNLDGSTYGEATASGISCTRWHLVQLMPKNMMHLADASCFLATVYEQMRQWVITEPSRTDSVHCQLTGTVQYYLLSHVYYLPY